LEADLLSGADTTAPTDGTETPAADAPVDGTEAPVDATSTDGTEAQGQEEDPLKAIQKLTGKLAQKMRDFEENISDKDIKYTLNSIISASDINKLSDEDKGDIIKKIEDKDEEQTTDNTELSEVEGDDENDSNFYDKLLNDKTVQHIIDMADLGFEVRHNPSEIAFDFCEAAYVFTHDYNDNTDFINTLKTILRDNAFKPKPTLNSKDDLELFGDTIYDALVKHDTEHTENNEVLRELDFNEPEDTSRFTASGGQTVGENAINERLIKILEQARNNVKNNLNNK
jgi:hypothetical protein